MPQLKTSPWFPILVFMWLVFSTVMPPKILSYLFPNVAAFQRKKDSKTATWPWPWH